MRSNILYKQIKGVFMLSKIYVLFVLIVSGYFPNLSTKPLINPNNPGADFANFESFSSIYDITQCDEPENITYLQQYFRNLDTFSPNNQVGSCGYVSLIQYLSYYDSFYNDEIIPESYDRSQSNVATFEEARSVSPGVQPYTYNSYDIRHNLYNLILNNEDNDYQLYLMGIFNDAKNRAPNEYSFSTGMWNYSIIAEHIPALSSFSFISMIRTELDSELPNEPTYQQQITNFVKAKLDLGEPVIIHIAKHGDGESGYYTDYHSLVAYYYDNLGIHCNFGWNIHSTDAVIPEDFYITSAGYFDFSNLSHTHSNNFKVNGNFYCGCGFETVHVSHDKIYTYYSNSKHEVSCCRCNYHSLENHVVNSSSIVLIHGHRYGNCIYCGSAIDLGTGGFTPIVPGDGGLLSEFSLPHSFNGSYILDNGVYVIVPEDMDDFINGTLIFDGSSII